MKVAVDKTARPWMRALLAGAFVAGILAGSGCALLPRPTAVPMPTRWFYASPGDRADTLIVFLPGRFDRLEDFEGNGLVEEMRAAGVRADTVAADAHLGYYFKRTLVDRLAADVFAPARTAGYRRIVLVGASLGGMGALICEREIPGTADAIVLLGPYLGDKPALFEEIEAAGGPTSWAAGRDPNSGRPDEMIWTFLGGASEKLPPTWLLAGDRDYLAPGHRMLERLLPDAHVSVIEGGHDWATWRALWRKLCRESSLFQKEKDDSNAGWARRDADGWASEG